jgi:hypothetical protein
MHRPLQNQFKYLYTIIERNTLFCDVHCYEICVKLCWLDCTSPLFHIYFLLFIVEWNCLFELKILVGALNLNFLSKKQVIIVGDLKFRQNTKNNFWNKDYQLNKRKWTFYSLWVNVEHIFRNIYLTLC